MTDAEKLTDALTTIAYLEQKLATLEASNRNYKRRLRGTYHTCDRSDGGSEVLS